MPKIVVHSRHFELTDDTGTITVPRTREGTRQVIEWAMFHINANGV